MRRLTATFAALSLLACAGTAIGAGGKPPQIPRIPGTWSHAEINVTIRRVPHTLILDRGKIMQVTATQLTLHRRDNTVAEITVNDQTVVQLNGRPASIFDLRRRMTATTMQIDGGAAVRVRATSV